MNFFNTIFYLLLFFAFNSTAQLENEGNVNGSGSTPPGNWSMIKNTSPKLASSLLWKIEGKGIKKNVYLFGTMHLIESKYFYFPENLKNYIKNSEYVITELGDVNPADGLEYLMLKKGSFFDYFNDEQTDSLLFYAMENMGMNESQFRMMMSNLKPFAMVQFAALRSMQSPTESYELQIIDIAHENQLKIKGLETIQQQLALFDKVDSLQTTRLVMESIENRALAKEEFQTIQQAYKLQDIDKLYELISNSNGVFSIMGIDLIDNRNSNWIKQLKKIITGQNVFIAVGAGHLSGPNGLLQQFRNEGYIVTPISY